MTKLLDTVINATQIGTAQPYHKGAGVFSVTKTAAAAAKLQYSYDGTNYMDAPIYGSTGLVAVTTGTGAGIPFQVPMDVKVRGVITTATSSTTGSVSAWV